MTTPWPYGWIPQETVLAASSQPNVILDIAQAEIRGLEHKIGQLVASQENDRLQHGALRLFFTSFVCSKGDNSAIHAEQVCHALETQWQQAARASADRDDDAKSLEAQVSQLKSDLQLSLSRETAFDNSTRQHAARVAQLQTQIDAAESLQREQLAVLEQRHREMDVQRSQLDRLIELERSLRAEKQETERKLFQADSELVQCRYQLNKSQTELVESTKAREWLESQLVVRSEQLAKSHEAAAAQEADHRQQITSLQAELASSSHRATEAEHNLAAACAERDQFRSAVSNAEQVVLRTQMQLEAKIDAQQRLIDLHASKSDEAHRRSLEAEAREEAAQQLLIQLKEQHQVTLMKEADRVSTLQEQLEASLHDVSVLRNQLNEVSRQVDAPAGSEPRLILSEEQLRERVEKLVQQDPSGKQHLAMLISLQQKYETTADSLRSERLEKNGLVALLQQIAEDLAAKEPLVERNRRDYERVKAEQSHLSASLEQSLTQNEHLKVQLDVHLRDSAQLRQENDDLSRQVAILLKECQQLQNQTAPFGSASVISSSGLADPNPNSSDGLHEGSASSDISTYSFRDIRDLQEKYRQLVRVVRELTTEDDDAAKQTTQQLLETALSELRQVSQVRERQEERLRHYSKLVESQKILIQEHEDKYQHLSIQYFRLQGSQTDGSVSLNSVPETAVAEVSAGRFVGMDDASRLQELRATVESLTAELKQSRDALLAVRLEFAAEKAKSESESQRAALSTRAISSLEEQIRDLRSRNTDISKQMAELEKQNSMLLRDRTLARDQATSLEYRLQSERVALGLAEDSVQRYMKDLAALREERSARESLVVQMQQALAERQSSFDASRVNAEASQRELFAQITSLRDELHRNRDQLQSERHEVSLLRLSAAQQLETSSARFAALSAELKTREEQLRAAQEALENSEHALSQAKADLAQLQPLDIHEAPDSDLAAPADPTIADAAAAVLARRRGQELRVAAAQLKSKEEELRSAREHLDSYRHIAQETTEALQKVEAAAALQASEAVTRLTQLSEDLATAQQAQVLAEEKSLALKASLEAADERLAHAEEAFAPRLLALDLMVQTLKSELEIAVTKQRAAEAERELSGASFKEMQSSYQRQVRELADALARNSALQEERDTLRRQSETEHSTIVSLQAKAAASATEHAALLAAATKQAVEERDRAEDALRQVTSLLRQVDSLTQNFASRLSPASAEDSGTASDVERINFLRREVEIHQLQLSVLRQDLERAKVQAEHFRQQADTYRNLLGEEQQKRVVAAQAHAEYADRANLLEQLSLLRESNVTLRAEAEGTLFKLEQSKVKIDSLEAERAPLLQSLAEAERQRESLRLQASEAATAAEIWQNRCQDMITRYQNIDAASHDALLLEAQGLRIRVEELTVSLSAAQQALSESDAQLVAARASSGPEHLETALKDAKSALAKKQADVRELLEKAKRFELDKKLAEQAKQKIEAELKDALARIELSPSSASAVGAENLNISDTARVALEKKIEDLEAEKAVLEQDVNDLTSSVTEAQQQVVSLQVEKSTMEERMATADKKTLTLEERLAALDKKMATFNKLAAFYKKHKGPQDPVAESHAIAENSPAPREPAAVVPPTALAPALTPAAAPPKASLKAPAAAAKKGKVLPVRGGAGAKKGSAKHSSPAPGPTLSGPMSAEAIAKRSRKFSQISGGETPAAEASPKRQKLAETVEENVQDE